MSTLLRFAHLSSLVFCTVLLVVGCGSGAGLSPDAACPAAAVPDSATGQDAGAGAVSFLPAGTPRILVKGGLVSDLDLAIGTNSAGDRLIGGKIEVIAGYVDDTVALDHVGSLTPPWHEEAMGQPLIVSIVGYSFYDDAPATPPHPDYAPARALFDALVNGLRTGDDQTGTRESPGGRVHCEVTAALHEAACYITGVVGARF